MSHARDCAYVVNDGPAPCTCGAIERECQAAWDRRFKDTVEGLRPIEVEILIAARDGKNAFDCLTGLSSYQKASRKRAISGLLRKDLLTNLPGPTFATLSSEGRMALRSISAGERENG